MNNLRGIGLMLIGSLFAGLPGSRAAAAPEAWDYRAHPVVINQGQKPRFPSTSEALYAFDGYGKQRPLPAVIAAWQPPLPSADKPAAVEIDYGRPIAVSTFVNYTYAPGNLDFRYMDALPAGFGEVRVLTHDEASTWSEVARLAPRNQAIQTLALPPGIAPARWWRLEVLAPAAGSNLVLSYELETWTGGAPVTSGPAFLPEIPAQEGRLRLGDAAADAASDAATEAGADAANPAAAPLALADPATALAGQGFSLAVRIDGTTATLAATGDGLWEAAAPGGRLVLTPKASRLGTLLRAHYQPDNAEGGNATRANAWRAVQFRLSVPNPELFFVPSYIWNPRPVERVVPLSVMHTALAALTAGGATYGLTPGSDRGQLGFQGGAAEWHTLIGAEPVALLITRSEGDWWQAYRHIVGEGYGFQAPRQTVPIPEVVSGAHRFLMLDEAWSDQLGTVRSWPPDDPFAGGPGGPGGFVAYGMYGTPYSLPLYWARHVMTGDPAARERMRSVVLWLCRSGIRMQDGPARGAFFNMQHFPTTDAEPTTRGMTQGHTPILTSQSTGSVLWSLLYYRAVTGDEDPEINRVITEAADWLVKTQGADGGWPYGHHVDGSANEGAPSSGTAWNLWALWRMGKMTGDAKYTEAAERGTAWFEKTFMEPHFYHGYWEDGGPNTHEGYECAVAALAFEEMGKPELSLRVARDAIQWVYTRRLEHRTSDNSAGLVSEQEGWPPASYCVPMFGLAAYSAWRQSGDSPEARDAFWEPYAMINRGVGWWFSQARGSTLWIVESTAPAPIGEPKWVSEWSDWCVGQVGVLSLRWLVREANRRGGEAFGVALDEETYRGTVAGETGHLWEPLDGFHPTGPAGAQLNWLGFRSPGKIRLIVMNDGSEGPVHCRLNSRDVKTHGFAAVAATVGGGEAGAKPAPWHGEEPVVVPAGGVAMLEWRVQE